MDWGELVVDADGTFEEGLVCIMDSWDQVLQGKIVRLIKVLWQHRGVEEATCETPRKSNFLKNGKMVISIKIQNFSRSRMMKHTSPLESSCEI